ncbi:MAG TPA: LPS export ABC transporter periplasmic protein LptC [Burkholderiales bacterium]|nr:LPS export ABC transporter periplasmic protein LptC [Burkholderiales bacterium]
MKRGQLTVVAPLLLAGMLAALTFWLDRFAQGPARDLVGPSRHDPDYIVDKLSGVRMGESGAVSYSLSAGKMVHYPDDDTTLLTSPRFVSYGSSKATVTITSSEGVVSGKGDHVYFQDDVRVTRAALEGSRELVMRTSFLHVIPDLHIAMTDRSVTLSDDANTVTAVGLEMNNETRVIKLLSKVQGTYDPGSLPRNKAGR